MKLDGPAVQYLLSREFGDVTGRGLFRGTMFDYPMLYDVSVDMRGHVVLVHTSDRPEYDTDMTGTLCVCIGEASANSAYNAGAATALIHGEVTFQHLYNRMQRVFVDNERLDARLHVLVDTYAGFQSLLEACAGVMGFPCALIDDQYRLICASSAQVSASASAHGQDNLRDAALEPDSIDLFMASREYRYMRASRRAFAVPYPETLMMRNVFSNDQLVGALVMEHGGDALSARFVRFLLNYMGAFVEEMYNRIGSFGVTTASVGQVKAAVQGVLAGDASALPRLTAALSESGHISGSDYVVIRVERSFTNEGVEERDYLVSRLERAWPYAYCFTHKGELFVLVDISEGDHGGGGQFKKELPIVARENLSKVGISRPFNEMNGLIAACAQATVALEWGSQVDSTNWCYRFDDYAFSWLVSQAVRDTAPEYVCHPAVTTLSRYDDSHGTSLLETLSTFMQHRYNATSASQALFVARSTLLHRLARIEELTGVDFEDLIDRTYLAFSLAMFDKALLPAARPARQDGGRGEDDSG